MLTVKQLKELLEGKDDEAIVVLPHGGIYLPLQYVWLGAYSNGKAGLATLTEQDIEKGFTNEDIISGDQALILVPSETYEVE